LQVLRFWKMSSFPIERSQKGSVKSPEARASVAEKEEFNFSKALDRPRALNIDRQRSCDDRSLTDLSVGFSPRHLVSKADITSRLVEHLEHLHSPLSKSGINTPRSGTWDSLTSEAWEALRRSLVYFRGQPVGTIAALDSSEENLNYDQVDLVISLRFLFLLCCLLFLCSWGMVENRHNFITYFNFGYTCRPCFLFILQLNLLVFFVILVFTSFSC